MEPFSVCNRNTIGISPLLIFNTTDKIILSHSCRRSTSNSRFIFASKFNPSISSSSSSSFRVNCCYEDGGRRDGDENLTTSSACDVLGVEPNCSSAQLKAAFRTKVKQFHPDVMGDGRSSDVMIRRVIRAYQILSNYSKSEIIESECMDPFDVPECEAFDLFVNEVLCIGKGCPYSCVNRAPHVFKFSSTTGTASATSQGEFAQSIHAPFPQDFVKTIKSSLQLDSVREVVFTMLHLRRELFWRSFLPA